MRPLVIGPDELAALARVKAHAEANFFDLATVKHAFENHIQLAKPAEFRCLIPQGFVVAFTIEQHPAGWCRHFSASLADAPPGKLPNSRALAMIGRELGMRMDIFDPSTTTYLEGEPAFAVSIIEPIDPHAQTNGPTPGD